MKLFSLPTYPEVGGIRQLIIYLSEYFSKQSKELLLDALE